MQDIQEYVALRAQQSPILSYLDARRMTLREFVDLLTTKTEGNFVYLRYVFPEIETGAYRDLDCCALPGGLQSYYDDHWRRMHTGSENDWFTYKLPIIAALTAIREPVSFGCAYFTTTHNRPQIYDLHPVGLLGSETKHGDMKISWGFVQLKERLEGSLASFPRA
jgi:hypothetical protein